MVVPDSSILLFLGAVVIISMSGVMMPGPVLAATVAKGSKDKHSGIWIGLGHGIVEMPLVAGIYLGLGSLFENQAVMIIIGLAGGAMLMYIGQGMLRHRSELTEDEKYLPHHPLVVGVLTSLSNPYFFLWWATVGLALISVAAGFAAWVVAAFAAVHLSCDIFWDWFVSQVTFRSRTLWKENTQAWIFGICGLILIVFGIYFLAMPLIEAVHG